MVKSELCNFERILPVVLDFADSSAAAIAITRELIEKITVVDAHLVRLKFLEEPDKIDQPIH